MQTLRGRVPETVDLVWADSVLSFEERLLFDRMNQTDQAHALEVARFAEGCLSESVFDSGDTAWVLRAAMLHDIGKVESGAGVWSRVLATFVEPVVGDRATRVLERGPWFVGRVGRHLGYTQRGADLLKAAGSDVRVVAWAGEHHSSSSSWSVPHGLGRILRGADDAAS